MGEDRIIDLEFSVDGGIVALEFGVEFGVDYTEIYAGDYTVTPGVEEEKVLPTKNKRMNDDVRVLRVPQYAVSNDAGGITLIIGDEYGGIEIH